MIFQHYQPMKNRLIIIPKKKINHWVDHGVALAGNPEPFKGAFPDFKIRWLTQRMLGSDIKRTKLKMEDHLIS